ncbi:MAG: PKD-like domain-containing protein [Bacteroidales bacterium]
MKLHHITLFILTFFILSSCSSELEDLNYQKIIKPQLINPEKDPALFLPNHVYKIKRGDTLQLSPIVEYHNMSDLKFTWYINGKEIGNEQELTWVCDISEKIVYGRLDIFRKSAGNGDIYPFVLEHDTPFERGFGVLAKKGGVLKYHFFQEVVKSPYFQYTFHNNAAARDIVFTNPVKMVEYWSCESPSIIGEMIYVDRNPEKCYSMQGTTLAPVLTLQQKFINEKFPDNLQVKDIMYAGFVSYILAEDGKLYQRKRGRGYYTGRYHDLPVQYKGEELQISKLIPINKYSLEHCLVYDSKYNRFLLINTDYSVVNTSNIGSKAGQIIEFPSSVGMSDITDKELVSCTLIKTTSTPYLFWAVFKGKTDNKYYARQFSYSFNGVNIVNFKDTYGGIYEEITDIDDKSQFAVVNDNDIMMVTTNFIYYTSKNNPATIYVCQRNASLLGLPRVFKTFDKKVVGLALNKVTRTQGNMCIGLEDGTVILYNLGDSKMNSAYEVFDETHILKVESGLGEIIDIKYKSGNLSNF